MLCLSWWRKLYSSLITHSASARTQRRTCACVCVRVHAQVCTCVCVVLKKGSKSIIPPLVSGTFPHNCQYNQNQLKAKFWRNKPAFPDLFRVLPSSLFLTDDCRPMSVERVCPGTVPLLLLTLSLTNELWPHSPRRDRLQATYRTQIHPLFTSQHLQKVCVSQVRAKSNKAAEALSSGLMEELVLSLSRKKKGGN